MNRRFFPYSHWTSLGAFVVLTVVFGLACGSGPDGSPNPPLPPRPMMNLSAADAVCGAPIFSIGRRVSFSELSTSGEAAFELREVHFRNVMARSPNDVELAYRIEMRMKLSESRFLEPVYTLACNEQNRPSRRAQRLSRTMIPVLGDLHLPSARITVFDQASSDSDLYNYPRISEVTVSNNGYFSFNQNWAPYRQVRTITQYMNLLRGRGLYQRVELREMGEGWYGIYAEKSVSGEKAQLMILLARAN